MKNESKILVLSLVFEYAFFQPLWSTYISGKLSLENINLYGVLSLACLSILTFYLILYCIKNFSIIKVFVSTLLVLVVLSFVGLQIDKTYSYKITPIGFDNHELHFAGFWILDEFEKDVIDCNAQNLNFYICFEGLDRSPWLFPDFYKYLLFLIGAIMTTLIFGVGYCGLLLYKASHNVSNDIDSKK